MNEPRFASEDDRRRFYGEVDRPPPPEEIELGSEWRARSDPAAVYTLRWVKDTRQIYITRRLVALPSAHNGEPYDYDDDDELDEPLPPPMAVLNMDFGIEPLGWAEDLASLQEALEGWEVMMHDDDGLEWIRHRLVVAAAETERRRGSKPAGWWPGLRRRP